MDYSVPIMLIATTDPDSRRILGDELRRRYGADYEVVACSDHAHGRAVLEGLRRCAQCGHIGCCDSSPSQHASAHARTAGHPVMRSFEPGEAWFYEHTTKKFFRGPRLPDPQSRPPEQPAPAPADKVPADWRERLHR